MTSYQTLLEGCMGIELVPARGFQGEVDLHIGHLPSQIQSALLPASAAVRASPMTTCCCTVVAWVQYYSTTSDLWHGCAC
jgi:hypothetical protein